MPDIIPPGDPAYNLFVNQFVPQVAGNAVTYGVTVGEGTAMSNGLTDWNDGYADHQTKAAAAQAATAVKNAGKSGLNALIRPIIQKIQANPSVSDEMRQLAGLPIPDRTPTRAPVPTSKPVLRVEMQEHFQHKLTWRDEATPKSKAKPKGVRGAQVRVHIGANPPVDPADFTLVTLCSKPTYLYVHQPQDAGKTAYYALRWENRLAEPGPWSDIIAATIPI
jgi:hypothetical protein